MPVFAKRLTPAWRKAFEDCESISGFEPMYQEQIDNGEMTPEQAWSENQQWFFLLYSEVQNISTPITL